MKSITARKSDNAIMSGDYEVMKARSWRQAEKILDLVAQASESGKDAAMEYGSSYVAFLANILGVDNIKLEVALQQNGLALAKK